MGGRIKPDIVTSLFVNIKLTRNPNNSKRRKSNQVKCVIHKTAYSEWTDACRNTWDRKAKECKVYKTGHYYNAGGVSVADDEVMAGLDPYEKLQFFEECLENKYNIEREMFQREVHSICLAICAHLIVGQQWRFVGKKIVAQRKWGTLIKSLSLFAMGYRRAGKTSAIQMHASTLAITVPGISISAFALAKRISIALGKGTQKMVIEAGYSHMLYARSDEVITLRVNENPQTERTIFMSPGNPDVYRFMDRSCDWCVHSVCLGVYTLYSNSTTDQVSHVFSNLQQPRWMRCHTIYKPNWCLFDSSSNEAA